MSLTRKPSAAYFAELKKYVDAEQDRHAKGKRRSLARLTAPPR